MATTFILETNIHEIADKNLQEFLEIFENKYEYIYDEPYKTYSYEDMLKLNILLPSILLGKKDRSTFGFYLKYRKEINAFTVRISTLVTTEDFIVALEFIHDFNEKFGGKIIEVKDKEFITLSKEDLKNYDYEKAIKNGLHFTMNAFNEHNMKKVYLGSKNILTLRKNDLGKILDSISPITSFDKLVHENTYLNEYRANQCFHIIKVNEEINQVVGYYELNPGKTVLKVSPNIENRNKAIVQQIGEFKGWGLRLNSKTNPIDYYFATNHINRKYFGIDNILIEDLKDEGIQNLINLYEEKMKFEQEFVKKDENFAIDFYATHYNKIYSQNLPLGKLNSLTHMAFFLKFMMDKDLVSNYFMEYYDYIKNNEIDLREIILYSMYGFIAKYLFNEKGLKFIEKVYPKYIDILNEIADNKLKIEETNDKYLFIPYENKYYEYVEEILSDLYYN